MRPEESASASDPRSAFRAYLQRGVKAYKEKNYLEAASNFDHAPAQGEWKMGENADYFHVCTNETVHGHRLPTWPTK